MPRADAAKLIGEQLHQLPMPDGRKYRLMHFSSFGQSEDIKAKVAQRAQTVGEAVVHLLELNGYRISHVNDPKPVEQEGRKVASGHCAHCSVEVIRLPVDDDLKATLSAQALRHLAKLNPTCPHQ